MKRITFLSIFSLLFLLVVGFLTCVTQGIPFSTPWIPIALSFAAVTVATVFALTLRKQPRIRLAAVSVFNAVSMGFAMRAWYLFRGLENDAKTLVLLALAATAVLLLYDVISFVPFVGRHYAAFFWILTVALWVGYIVAMIKTDTTCLSTFGFYLVVVNALVFALCGDGDSEDFYNVTVLSTYSVWVVAILVLLLVAAGEGGDCCDGCDGCDGCNCSPDSPRKQKTLKR